MPTDRKKYTKEENLKVTVQKEQNVARKKKGNK
jgi:hypothetical protein